MPLNKLLVEQAERGSGTVFSGEIGASPRKRYYTPDGRVIFSIPAIRDYVRKDRDGKIIEQGTRDANLDKGWFLQKPQVLKMFCRHCDEWHDTQVEIDACAVRMSKMIEFHATKAREEMVEENANKDIRIEALSQKVEALTALVEKLTGGVTSGSSLIKQS